MDGYNSGSYSYGNAPTSGVVSSSINAGENPVMSDQDRLKIMLAIAASNQGRQAPVQPQSQQPAASVGQAPVAAQVRGQMAAGPLPKSSYPAGSVFFGNNLSPERQAALARFFAAQQSDPRSQQPKISGQQSPNDYMLAPQDAAALDASGIQSRFDFLKSQMGQPKNAF